MIPFHQLATLYPHYPNPQYSLVDPVGNDPTSEPYLVLAVGIEPTLSLPTQLIELLPNHSARQGISFGTHGWIRTYNQQILSLSALPISVHGHYIWWGRSAWLLIVVTNTSILIFLGWPVGNAPTLPLSQRGLLTFTIRPPLFLIFFLRRWMVKLLQNWRYGRESNPHKSPRQGGALSICHRTKSTYLNSFQSSNEQDFLQSL